MANSREGASKETQGVMCGGLDGIGGFGKKWC